MKLHEIAKLKKEMKYMLKNKKGFSIGGKVNEIILAIVLLVLLFELYAELVPTAQTSGDTLCNTGVPLASLFRGAGFLFILVMVGLIITVVKIFLPGGK